MNNILVKFYNFVYREFAYSSQVDNNGNYLPYGPSDTFPVELADLVDGSPTATSCLSTNADFVTGEGFSEGEDLENLPVNNQGLTFFQFHAITANSFTHNWGMATLVLFNKVGEITELYPLPFGNCRLGKPDDKGVISDIKYNPYFGTALYKSADTVIYPVFNPSQAVVQIGDKKKPFKGQIFWYGARDRKHPFYPVPDYFSAKYWMRVEKNASIYFDENLQNGFLQSSIMKILGDPNDPSGVKDKDGNDIPKGKVFDEEMTKNFSGTKRVAAIMTMWANNKEEFPTLEAFPTSGGADMYRVQDEHATKKITIATKVPAILANISEGVSLGGDGNTIRAAVKLMQQRVKRPQEILTGYYGKMLSKMVNPIDEPVVIVPYNPFPEIETIDPQVWAVLTPEEKRQWVRDHTEVDLIEEDVAQQVAVDPAIANKFKNLLFNTYPPKAKENVKRAVEWQEKFGATCLKRGGLKTSQAILDGAPLAYPVIKRLSNFLSKKSVYKNLPYGESCDALEYDAWGGSEMMLWANEKVRELNGKAD